jgi:D-glucosaminate-6-phosphate ammonia-lyase
MKRILRRFAMSFVLLWAGVTSGADDKAAGPAKCAPDVSGTWNLTVEFSGGGGNPVFSFKQDGEQLTGRYRGAFGEADVTGTVKGNEVKFSFKTADQGENMSYSGVVAGDSMKGKVTLGSYGEGTFAGKKEAKK